MNTHPSTRPSLLRRHVLGALALIATFVLSPVVLGAAGIFLAQSALHQPAAQTFSDSTLQPPTHDPAKPTVAIIASNQGTEISDFLAPYEVFATAGAFNVYAVAPEREFTPFMWGGLDFMPHYSFAELDQLLGTDPDVIVIPFIKDPENPTIIQWIRDHAGPDTLVVSICAGAGVLAATGLVDDGKMTTHQSYFSVIEKNFPQIELVRGVRYTDNGNTITSAGITAGIDASLYAIKKLLGNQAAFEVAYKLNYPHTRFLDNPLYQVPTPGAAGFAQGLNAGFLWDKQEIGVALFEGVGEIDLTAVLDSYGRTFTGRTTTFAAERKVIRSRHNLYLIPRTDYAGALQWDRIIVPGHPAAPISNLAEWAQATGRPTPDYLYADESMVSGVQPFAFDATISDIAQRSSQPDAHISAITLEYPADHLQLGGRSWPLQRLTSGLVVALASVTAVWMLQQRGRSRQRIAAPVQRVAASPTASL
jgi:putative intracellular protease/amidase